jgi:hypothetical protein
VADDKQNANTRDENGKFLPGYTPPTAWQPGQCPNPKGRPVNENSITYWLKYELAQINGGGKPTAHSIAKGIIAEAKKRKPWACDFVADRTEGKPKQSLELTGRDGKDLIPDAGAALEAKLDGIASTIATASDTESTDG